MSEISEGAIELSVVIPVYNAAAFILDRLDVLVRYLDASGLAYEVLPVDDGSADGTSEQLAQCGFPRVRPILASSNSGKFGALAIGIREARGRCCIITDADIPYDLRAIPYLVGLINEHHFHVAICDRSLSGSYYPTNHGLLRRVTTRAFTFFVRVVVTGGLFDTQCGLKALDTKAAKALFAVMREKGFAGDVEMLYIALRNNLAIRRVPVRLEFEGPSSVRPFRDGLRMLRSLMRIRWRRHLGRYESPELAELGRQDYWNSDEPGPRG